MFNQDIYDNSIFDHDPAKDIQSSSFHATYLTLWYVFPTVTSAKSPLQVVKDVQDSFNVSNTRKDSPKDSIDDITTLVCLLEIPITLPISSISLTPIHIKGMAQQVTTQEKNKGKAPMNDLSLKGDQESRDIMKIKEDQDKCYSHHKKLLDQ